MTRRVGEVIQSGTVGFVGQSYELHQAPPFGGLVRVGDGSLAVYGLVYDVTTSSIDPGRRPIARGEGEVDEESIFRNNPQLAKLFRTEFSCLVSGFIEAGRIFHFLPARPPRVHAFIYECAPAEIVVFTQSLDFLPRLFTSGLSVPEDELVAAFLRSAGRARPGDGDFMVKAGKDLAILLSRDLQRLNAILRRIKP